MLSDQDDAPQVWVGLAMAMYMSDELTDAVIKKASKGFAYLTSIVPDEYKTVFIDAGTAVCDLPHTGKKKAYSKPVRYTVPWRDGDTFCYKMSGAYPARFGLDDWNIIARKVGISAADDTQLVCLTLSRLRMLYQRAQANWIHSDCCHRFNMMPDTTSCSKYLFRLHRD